MLGQGRDQGFTLRPCWILCWHASCASWLRRQLRARTLARSGPAIALTRSPNPVSCTAPQDGTSYNVGTQLNAFVYSTLASWYNEDVQAAGQPQKQLALIPGPPPGERLLLLGGVVERPSG